MSIPELIEIKLLQKSHTLILLFAGENQYELSCEYLRVFSPSAEVQGHGQAEPNLVAGKQQVSIIGIVPVGNYGIKLIFDDKHDTGIYTFEYLYQLGQNYSANWQRYLARLAEAHLTREANA